MKKRSLIFVYNANSGSINALLGTAHKILSPQTYECSLCALTFGNFNEYIPWKAFRESSDVEMIFLHKDEFLKQFRSKWLPKYDFPVVFFNTKMELDVFMSSSELNQIATTQILIDTIKEKFIQLG